MCAARLGTFEVNECYYRVLMVTFPTGYLFCHSKLFSRLGITLMYSHFHRLCN